MIEATISPSSLPSWSSGVGQAVGSLLVVDRPGVQYVRDLRVGMGEPFGPDHLVYRDSKGLVRGYLALYRRSNGWRRNSFLVHVDPACRHRGIATLLLREAEQRWPGEIDLRRQRYTPDGAKWAMAITRGATSK